MKKIQKSLSNMGGLLKIWAIPANRYWLTKTTFIFQDPNLVYSIYCSPDSLEMSEPKTTGSAGSHYKTTVSGFIPENRQEVADAILEMEGRPFVILLLDGNGKYILVGTSFYPLRINLGFNPGKTTADLAGTSFSFEGITITRALIVDNPF